MTVQRRGISKNPESSAIEKKIKRGNAQRQASSWRGNVITLLLLTGATGLVSWVYFTWTDDFTHTLVSRSETLTQPRVFTVECSEDYKKYKFFPGCTPTKCGRAITDSVVTLEEAQKLRRLAERGLSLAGSDGGASILDLHSGALSMGKQFVNIYSDVRSRIQKAIAETFGMDSKQMYLTKPTFFSRINSTSAKTTHDEYWHPHIDKETYGSFDYTSLLYLSDYGVEFGGGRFVFMDPSSNRTVEPRAGRVSFFSSGSENLHHVEKVTWGTRYAITVSFTCDPDYAIDNPSLP
ncbi:2-oxoglutarate and iron-dependent oxygenase domain-containing 3 [Labeo rohita]|uniref:2-oxoglutarate and iron-dependent oxygenase domain-containing 3 n=1 Tax=Labeo rohita TaxID=84645 RepID=A0A498LRE0_LABRO|nr:2-oxoglutarate and iron-dependent oxygenase domain-containing 3 [Labeo rohita]